MEALNVPHSQRNTIILPITLRDPWWVVKLGLKSSLFLFVLLESRENSSDRQIDIVCMVPAFSLPSLILLNRPPPSPFLYKGTLVLTILMIIVIVSLENLLLFTIKAFSTVLSALIFLRIRSFHSYNQTHLRDGVIRLREVKFFLSISRI